ncbi:MAG: hypothetical protein K1X35_00235 [Caulobacteraceae bacterium]|nr:hypothetical protein [Caulobacteraceae bacterium]
MSDPEPPDPRTARPTRLLLIAGVLAPCVVFVVAMAGWIAAHGLADSGGGALGGLLTFAGIAVIGVGYWLAERYWIRK